MKSLIFLSHLIKYTIHLIRVYNMKTLFIICKKRFDYFNFKKNLRKATYHKIIILDVEAAKYFNKKELKYFDKNYIISFLNKDNLEIIINNHIHSGVNPLDIRIVCTDELLLLSCAEIRSKYKIPGMLPQTLMPFRDKCLMKSIVTEKGLQAPKFISLNEFIKYKSHIEIYNKLIYELGDKFIIKNLRGASSLNTFIINNINSFSHWIMNNPDFADYEAEEFVDGTLYHCDGFIINNKIIFSCVFEYINPCLDFTFGKILGSSLLPLDNTICLNILQKNTEIIKALGLSQGAFHAEYFINLMGKIVFLEIGARPAGGPIVELIEKSHGFNLYEAVLNHEMNLPITQNLVDRIYTAWAYLPVKLGKIKKLIEPQIKSSFTLNWNVKVGDTIVELPNSVMAKKSGLLLLENSDYSILREDINYLRQYNPTEVE